MPEVDLVICCQPPSDYESYIHRSGRTGRAGRTGVCVCFYKSQETNALSTLEYKTVSLVLLKIFGQIAEQSNYLALV